MCLLIIISNSRIRQLGQEDLKVYGCKQVMNCTVVRGLPFLDAVHRCIIRSCVMFLFSKVCPKGLNPGLSISRLKLLTLKLQDLDKKMKDKEAVEQAIHKFIGTLPPVTEA